MAGERVKLVVQERKKLGSAETRRLLKQGLIPGVLYGHSTPVSLMIPERDLRAALTTPAGMHAVLDVTVDGGSSHSAILKEFQLSAVRGKLTHIDLQEVRLDQPIHTTVTVTLIGEAVGVKEGGVLNQPTNEINIESLPLEVPQHLELDVSDLKIGESLRLSALAVPSAVTLLDDLEETVLATVTAPMREEELEEAAEGEEGETTAEATDEESPESEAAEDGAADDAASEE
ncbi:MAG TPA: 50S ribosomal protein L25 [Gaiellaceae bacterium]|nr:50S ribosomal protein L25 [Gaiellaceae bacterium]